MHFYSSQKEQYFLFFFVLLYILHFLTLKFQETTINRYLESNLSRLKTSTKYDGFFLHFYSSQKNHFLIICVLSHLIKVNVTFETIQVVNGNLESNSSKNKNNPSKWWLVFCIFKARQKYMIFILLCLILLSLFPNLK